MTSKFWNKGFILIINGLFKYTKWPYGHFIFMEVKLQVSEMTQLGKVSLSLSVLLPLPPEYKN